MDQGSRVEVELIGGPKDGEKLKYKSKDDVPVRRITLHIAETNSMVYYGVPKDGKSQFQGYKR